MLFFSYALSLLRRWRRRFRFDTTLASSGWSVMCRRSAGLDDINVHNPYRMERQIGIRIARHSGNLLHQRDARRIALTKDGMTSIQMWSGNFGNKKLRSVGVRP